MAITKHKFTDDEQYAVWRVHGCRCFYCGRPLRLDETWVDHIIPEALLGRPTRLREVLADYGLDATFEVNSYENWVPTDRCNARKGARILRQGLARLPLQLAGDKAAEAKQIAQKERQERTAGKILGPVRVALARGFITNDHLSRYLPDITVGRSQSPPVAPPPGFGLVDEYLGEALGAIERGEYPAGLAALERAGRISDPSGWPTGMEYRLRTYTGQCHLVMRRYPEAREALQRAAALQPANPRALVNLVIARSGCGESPQSLLDELAPVLREDRAPAVAVHTQANLLVDAGRPHEALRVLSTDAGRGDPADARRDFAITYALQAAGDLGQAEAAARRCVAQSPEVPEAHEMLANVLFAAGAPHRQGSGAALAPFHDIRVDLVRLAEAAAAYRLSAERFMAQGRVLDATKSWINCACCLLEADDRDAAREVLARLDGDTLPTNYRLPVIEGRARLALTLGDAAGACSLTKQALELDPESYRLQFLVCFTSISAESYEQAEQPLAQLKARTDLPEHIREEVTLLEVDCLWGQGRHEEALAKLSALVSHHPDDWSLLLSRADYALRAGDPDSALAYVEQARCLAPDALTPLRYAARVAYYAQDWPAVVATAEALRSRYQEGGMAPPRWLLQVRAEALVESRRWEEAINALDATDDNGAAIALHMRALCLMGLHRYPEARGCWRQVLELDPGNDRARIGLGHAELHLLNLDEAHRQLSRAAASAEPDPTFYMDLAVLCQEREAPGEAIEWAQKATSCGGDTDPDILRTLIFVLRECGRPDLAQTWIALYEERWPDQVPEHAAVPEDMAWGAYRNGPVSLAWLAEAIAVPVPEVWRQVVEGVQPGQSIRSRQPGRDGDWNDVVTAGDTDAVAPDLLSLLALDTIGHLGLLRRLHKRVIVTDRFINHAREQARHLQDPSLRARIFRVLTFLRREDTVVCSDAAVQDEYGGDRSHLALGTAPPRHRSRNADSPLL